MSLFRKKKEVKFEDQKICGNCKYYAQGLTCSFCEHPKQPNEDAKNYRYYIFSCSLFTKGIAQSRIDYMNKTGIFKK